MRMDALPKGAHYVGNTALSLEHIRNFNAERCVQYLLHDNDCRHYVNDLCAHLCPNAPEAFPRGVASKVSWQSAWQRVRGGRPHEALVVLPLQVFADVNNAPAVQRMKHAASASFAFGLGMRVVAYLARSLGLRSGVAAALGTFSRAAPTRRLVTTAAGPSRGSPRKRRWSGRRSCSGAPRWAAPSTSPGAWPARAPTSWRLRRTASGWGRRPGCRDGAAAGTSMRAASAAATAAGEFAANAKAGEFVSNAGASLAAGAAVGAAAAVAPRRRRRRARAARASSRRATLRIASASWARTPDGTRRGGFVTWLGVSARRARRRRRYQALARPRAALGAAGARRARAPRRGRRRRRGRARRSGVAEEEGIAGCAPRVAVRRPRGSVREGAAVRRAARLREGALRREPCRRQRRGVVDAVTVRARRDVFKLLISIRLPRTPSTTT